MTQEEFIRQFQQNNQPQFNLNDYFVSEYALQVKVDEFIKALKEKYSEHEIYEGLLSPLDTPKGCISLPQLAVYKYTRARITGQWEAKQ